MIYPIVKIPAPLEKVDKLLLKLPTEPVPPQKPKKAEERTKPTIRLRPKSGMSSILWGIGIVFMSALPLMSGSKVGSGFVLLGLIIGVPFFLGGWSDESSHNSFDESAERNSYQKKLNDYHVELHNAEVSYQEALSKYEELYKRYLIDKYKYENECQRLRSPEVVEKAKIVYIINVLSKTIKPILHNNTDNILRGVSEDSFFQKLKDSFGNSIVRGYTIPLKGYLPDIVLYEKNLGLCIDIEIDEPYIGSTGEPIHYSESSIDIERNDFFLKAGWLVIRFTEEQVVKYPSECCDFIIETIENITKSVVNTNTFSYSKYGAKLISVKQWTKDDAHKLAFARYRNTYLPRNLVEKISIENMEWFINNSTDKITLINNQYAE